MNKNDYKYIVKRIIVGVVIFLIIMLFKNNVKADSNNLYLYNFYRNSGVSALYDTSQSSYYWSGVGNITLSTAYNINEQLNGKNLYLGVEKSGGGQVGGTYYALFQKGNENTYQLVVIYSNNTTNLSYLQNGGSFGMYGNTCQIYDSNNNLAVNNVSCFSVLLTSQQSTKNQYSSYFTNQTSLQNEPVYGYYSLTNLTGSSHHFSDYISDFTYIGGNIDFYIDNNLQIVNSFPPSGFQEINLENHQGVFFVAKNYENVNCSLVGDLCNTSFTYYYQNDIKEAYFPLDNHFKLRFNSEVLYNNSDPEEKNSYFPLYQQDGNKKYYYAFMIYNQSDKGDVLNPASYSPYGPAKIWYDSTKYNYYIVDDFNTYSEVISYDVGNDTLSMNITGLPTLKKAIEDAEQQSLLDSFDPQSNNVILEFLRIPFTFLNRLNTDSCTPIELPIPFLNSNITLSCLSTTFHQVMGNYYNIVAIFINGLLLYSITLYNIKTFKECLDPQDDKLEVVDL